MKTKTICLVSPIGYSGKNFSTNLTETLIFGTQDKCDDNIVMVAPTAMHNDFLQGKIKSRNEFAEMEKLIK